MFSLVFRTTKVWLSIPAWFRTCTSRTFLRFFGCKFFIRSKISPLSRTCVYISIVICCWKVSIPAINIGIGSSGCSTAMWKSSVNVKLVILAFWIDYVTLGLFPRLIEVFTKEWAVLIVECTFCSMKSVIPIHKIVRCILKWIHRHSF